MEKAKRARLDDMDFPSLDPIPAESQMIGEQAGANSGLGKDSPAPTYHPGLRPPEPRVHEEPAPTLKVKPKPERTKTKLYETDPRIWEDNKLISTHFRHRAMDQIKLLRTQILEHLKDLNGNSVLITSSGPGEGKTLTAINLAISFAEEVDLTTLLVDADLRQPCIAKRFGYQGDRGLSNFLQEEVDVADLMFNPGIPKLTILPGGKPLPNSTELLGAPKMEALFREMKSRYPDRLVIVDSSSILMRADPIVFSRYVDGVILVIEAEKTSKHKLRRALELLGDRPIIGTVFNKVRGVQ